MNSFEEEISEYLQNSEISKVQQKGRIEGYRLAKYEVLQKVKELKRPCVPECNCKGCTELNRVLKILESKNL